jgi:hypothetical protein
MKPAERARFSRSRSRSRFDEDGGTVILKAFFL